jgi:uncharacterized protein with beta-barrel porin domain
MSASALALGIGTTVFSPPAQAACTQVGSTVTCDGLDDNGFTGGNSLTLNALTGSFVQSVYDGNPSTFCPSFRAAVRLGSSARISNAGQILGRGNCGLGIDTGDGLVLSNTGDIRTDSEVAYGILTGSTFDITNSGTIRTVNATSVAVVAVNNGRIINTSTGVIETTGADAPALSLEDTNTITNNGAIRTSGTGSHGIDAGARNTITTTGTISVSGIGAIGVRARGTGNTITNSGTISAIPTQTPRDGEDSIGISFEDGRNTLTNTGTINGNYAGVVMTGAANRLTNTGTITARAPTAATQLGGAIILENGASTITNSGTIRGTGSAAIRTRSGATLQLTNTGTIDGDIIMGPSAASAVTLGTGSSINGTIVGSGGGLIGLTGTGTLSNAILNVGNLTQIGDGTWTLARRYEFQSALLSAANGTLILTDGLGANGLVDVQKGRLAGVGTIAGFTSGLSPFVNVGVAPTAGSTTANAVAVLAPGLSTTAGARLSINGRLSLQTTSQVALDVSATANDRIDVTGNVSSGGSLVITYAGAPVRSGQTFTLMTAGTITTLSGQACAGTVQDGAALGTGCFTITDNSPFFVRSSAVVTNTSVTLNVQRTAFASVGQTSEQVGLGAAFDTAVAAGTDPLGLVARFDSMTGAQVQSVLASLTTDSPAAAQTWTLLAAQTTADTLSPWLDLSSTTHTRGTWRTWGSFLARTGESGPKTDSSNFDYEMKGVSAGVDYAITDDTRIGLTASYIDGDTFFAVGNAKNDLSTTTVGLYAVHQDEALFGNVGGFIGDGSVTATRLNGYVDPLALVIGNLSAKADTDMHSVFGEAGYIIPVSTWQIKPTMGLNYAHVKIDALTENVATGLAVNAQKASSVRGDVGVRANSAEGPVRISVGAFWSQNLKDNDRIASARLVGFTGGDFIIVGRAEKRGWLKTQAAASMDLTPALTAKLAWTGILNDRLGGHAATAGISYRW